ncbi:MAG: hypothetical protein CM15mP2_1690 [Methanobacteriota archaeon]|nr:MAG: hypothetical protein CM15mP2_1690 [Euryarchaeota archaeon]
MCVHGRTLRQRYSGIADWDYIKQVVESVEVPVVANGDVVDSASAAKCLEKTNASGLMIGRGAIGRPAMFGYLKVGLGWMEEAALPWVKLHDDWQEMDEIQQAFATRKWCWDRYIQLSKDTVGIQPRWMQRHAVAFSKGLPGGKKIRSIMHEMPTPEDFAGAKLGISFGNTGLEAKQKGGKKPQPKEFPVGWDLWAPLTTEYFQKAKRWVFFF